MSGSRYVSYESQPLAGLRLVVTMPPAEFWYGRDLALASDQARSLRELGATLFEFDTTAFCQRNFDSVSRQLELARDFRPDAAVSLANAGYAVGPKLPNKVTVNANDAKNLFLDLLDLPTVLYWDHALLQAPMYVTPNWPAAPDETRNGIIEQLRILFNHPRSFHFFPDSGDIVELNKIGLAEFDATNRFVPGVPNEFLAIGERARERTDGTVAFFGNLYLTAAERKRHAQAELLAIREKAIAAYKSDWDLPPFEAYGNVIDGLNSDVRTRLHLHRNQMFHWCFLANEIGVVVNGEPRLRRLLACGHPVVYFGGFADPGSMQHAEEFGFLTGGDLPPDETLATAFQRTSVSLDIANAAFIDGCPLKLLSCYAAGGFMLVSRKPDIALALGELGDAVGFSSGGELAAKIEHYLSCDNERKELADEIGARVRQDYSTRSLFARTLPLALERLRAR